MFTTILNTDMSETKEFPTVLHKYWAFWKAKKDIYQAVDVALLFLTGGFWTGWLLGEMIRVSMGWSENEGTLVDTEEE